PPSGLAAAVTFGDPTGPSAGLTEVWAALAPLRVERETQLLESLAHRMPRGLPTTPDSWTAQRRLLANVAGTQRHEIVRKAAAMAYFADGTFTEPTPEVKELARNVVKTVPPTDPLWSLMEGAFPNVVAVAKEPWAGAYVQEFLTNNADTWAVAEYLDAEI